MPLKHQKAQFPARVSASRLKNGKLLVGFNLKLREGHEKLVSA
jgi:hypothetical protein